MNKSCLNDMNDRRFGLSFLLAFVSRLVVSKQGLDQASVPLDGLAKV